MKSYIPQSQVIITYENIFEKEPPEDRLSFLKGMCKGVVLAEIAGLNYRLKPRSVFDYDTSLKTQSKELHYFCGSNDELFKLYALKYRTFVRNEDEYGLLFCRHACLFAMEEIVQSDMKVIKGFRMADHWPQLLNYLLCANYAVTTLKRRIKHEEEEEEEETVSEREEINSMSLLEEVNFKLIPINEMSIACDPFHVVYRGFHLLQYLSEHSILGSHLNQYFQDKYGLTWEHFIFELLSMYLGNNENGVNDIYNDFTGERLDATFIYHAPEFALKMFQTLSQRVSNEKCENLLSIKKSPFVHYDKNQYVLTDFILLLDKLYSQLINDFWFDKVKGLTGNGKQLIPVTTYYSYIGYFFENYVGGLFAHFFKRSKHIVHKCTDELKYFVNKQPVEFSDIYVRDKKRVFLAQVKVTGIYDKEKYSNDLDGFYKNDRNNFFNSFGMEQLLTSIEKLEKTIEKFDNKFPIGKAYKIYPALIVNEKAIQTPLMAYIFDKRFQELVAPYKSNRVLIFPLSIIHVSDLECMQDSVNINPSIFFEILDSVRLFSKFMPPFYNILLRNKIMPTHERTRALIKPLIKKFNSEK